MILLCRTDFSLFSVMKQIENLFAAKTGRKGIEYIINISGDVPDRIVTDKSKLRQILINLIGNSVKFTDTGSIKVGVSLADDDPGILTFTVSDTGKGISSESLETIFNPFEQGVDGKWISIKLQRRFFAHSAFFIVQKKRLKSIAKMISGIKV